MTSRASSTNTLLRSFAPQNLRAIATTFEANVNYIPLNTLSLAIDYHLWGLAPAGYHATNLLFHAANAALVYLVVLRLGESALAALAIALLWALHPVQVESVAWISERKNLLSTLFFLLAFLAYLRFSEQPRPRPYLWLLILYVCALLSKINTIVLPAIMIAYEIAMRRRLRGRDIAATLPLLAAGALLAWINLAGNPSHGAAYHGDDFWVNLRTTASVVPRYLELVLVPLGTSSYQAVNLRASWLDPPVLLGVVTILGLIAAALVLLMRGHPGAFWVIWLGVTLAPMLNLIPFPARMADRYLYIPLVGPLVLVASGVRALARRWPRLAPAVPALAGVAVVVAAGLTVVRIPAFHDELSLWADWALRTPYISADRPYGPQPRPRELQLLRDALARNHDSAALHNNIGAIAFEENRMSEAVAELARAHALDPRDPTIALNLGRAYLQARQPEAAARALEDAVRLEPPSFWAHLNLGRAYLMLGDAKRARPALERVRAMRPTWRDWRADFQMLEQLERGAG